MRDIDLCVEDGSIVPLANIWMGTLEALSLLNFNIRFKQTEVNMQ